MCLLTLQILLLTTGWVIGVEDDNNLKLPDGLMIGVGGSSYQVEGAWNVSDKTPSNWDSWAHRIHSSIFEGHNADVACNTYFKYKEDIQITKDAGFQHYRLSLSWPRILPNGFGSKISKDGIQYYKDVLDELHLQGIEPFVTIYHWDHPEIFDKMGGWLNELIIEYFADYARIVFQELGSRVKFWTTINEPNIYCEVAYAEGRFPPGLILESTGPYICMHNMLKAHARAYRIYDEEFRAIYNGKIGMVASCGYYYSMSENDTESSDIAHHYKCGWAFHPIHSKVGDYPEILKRRIAENSALEGLQYSRLPTFSPFWINYIKGTHDYFALNHYGSEFVQSVPKNNITGWYKDSGLHVTDKIAVENELILKSNGFRNLLRRIKELYDNPDIYILENGIYHTETKNPQLFDYERIESLHSYMKGMLLAIHEDNIKIKAYTIWSLLDNFEWSYGYSRGYGLVHVNFTDPNRTRTPRLSVAWIKYVNEHRKLIPLNETDIFT